MEDGNFKLSTRFLEQCPVTSSPTNQKKVSYPAALTPSFAHVSFSPQTRGVWGVISTSHVFFLHGPAIKLSLLQTLTFWVCLASLCTGHTDSHSVTAARADAQRLRLSPGQGLTQRQFRTGFHPPPHGASGTLVPSLLWLHLPLGPRGHLHPGGEKEGGAEEAQLFSQHSPPVSPGKP